MTPEEMPAAADRIDRAADKLTDLAEAASPGPWKAVDDHGLVSVATARNSAVCTDAEDNGPWIAAISPVVLPPLVAWLRDAAECIREHLDGEIASDGDAIHLCANELQAYDFAELVMGGDR